MEPLLMAVLLLGFAVLVLGVVVNLGPHEPVPDEPPTLNTRGRDE